MRHLRVVFFIFLLIVIIYGSFGCYKYKMPSSTFVIGISADPMFLNPVLCTDMTSKMVNAYIFNTLLKYDENLKLTGDLAQRWECDKSGLVWTFYLKKGIKWHDGMPFSAKDVKFTFDKLLDPSTNTFNRGYFQINGKNIEFEVIDDLTVKAKLPEKMASFLSNLTIQGIIPEHILKGEDINRTQRCQFNSQPIGTGPYKFKYWRHSDHIMLEANNDYFKGSPKIPYVAFRIIPSNETRRLALQTQQIDYCDLTDQNINIIKNIEYINIYKWLNFDYTYLGFDLTKPLFQDKLLRKAINYAIDKDKIVKATLKGLGEPATGPIAKSSWAYTENVPIYEYNPQKAKQLLNEAGWHLNKDGWMEKKGKIIEFTINYRSGRPHMEMAVVLIQDYLKDIGIKVNLRSCELSVLIRSCNPGDFEAVLLNWIEETYDPDVVYVEWHSSMIGDQGLNFMSYKNPEADKLLDEAQREYNIEKRKELYYRFQYIVADDAPYIFLWNSMSVAGVNKRVKGLAPESPAGILLYPEKMFIVISNGSEQQ